ncbi:MAG: Stage IV sporulation protein FB [Chlamydiae bacterium]|nr:Stage IV sporulation protein FB [Chlamydiota bacterium]
MSSSRSISIKISPFFWVTAGLIGWINSMSSPSPLLFTVIWIFVIFISILVHEFGHALTSRYFGQKPRIELVAFGGLTYPEGPRLRGWREFLMVLNGPIFGFILFLLATMVHATGFFTATYAVYCLLIFQWVNLFWTVVNLLPVMPLDGGQLLRIIFESICGAKGLKYALFTSMLLSATFSVIFFTVGFFIVGAIFFLFAFQNFATWRKTRVITESDRDDDLTAELKEIEECLAQGRKQDAMTRLEAVRAKAKKGLIFNITSQYLASLKAEKREFREVYELLNPIKKHLNPESQIHLFRAAYEMKDYPLVLELAPSCFQILPDPDIAARCAEACAALDQGEPAIGWLKAARNAGFENLDALLSKEVFNPIRNAPAFKELLNKSS